MRKLNKKASSFSIEQIVVMILVILVIISGAVMIFKPSLMRWIKEMPDYNYTSPGEVVYNIEDLRIQGLCGYQVASIRNDYIWMHTSEEKVIYKTDLFVKDNTVIWLNEWENEPVGKVMGQQITIDKIWIEDLVKRAQHPKIPNPQDLRFLNGAYIFNNIICRKESKEDLLFGVLFNVQKNYNSLYKVTRGLNGDVLINIKNKECLNPQSDQIQIFFNNNKFLSMGGGAYVGFVWDAQKNMAFAKDASKDGNDNSWSEKDLADKKNRCTEYFPGMDCTDAKYEGADRVKRDDFDNVLKILQSTSFNEFVTNIFNIGVKNGNYILSYGTKIENPQIADVRLKLVQSRGESYFNNWVNSDAKCKAGRIFTCTIFDQASRDCILKEDKFCFKDLKQGEIEECGKTCFCQNNYEQNDVLYLKIENQDWQFMLDPKGRGYLKRCTSGTDTGCPPGGMTWQVVTK